MKSFLHDHVGAGTAIRRVPLIESPDHIDPEKYREIIYPQTVVVPEIDVDAAINRILGR